MQLINRTVSFLTIRISVRVHLLGVASPFVQSAFHSRPCLDAFLEGEGCLKRVNSHGETVSPQPAVVHELVASIPHRRLCLPPPFVSIDITQTLSLLVSSCCIEQFHRSAAHTSTHSFILCRRRRRRPTSPPLAARKRLAPEAGSGAICDDFRRRRGRARSSSK